MQTRLWEDAVASEQHPIVFSFTASAANPDQELKQTPRFPRLNIVMICNPHEDNIMNGLPKRKFIT